MKRREIKQQKEEQLKKGYIKCDNCNKGVLMEHGCSICEEKGEKMKLCHLCAGNHSARHGLGFGIKQVHNDKEYKKLLDTINNMRDVKK
jgi:hypothetical protein